jgi:GTP cyclohydrolase I
VNKPLKKPGLQSSIEQILHEVGEDPNREGLLKTPERVEKSLKFLTSGYKTDIHKLVNDALYSENYNEMVIVKILMCIVFVTSHATFFGNVM